MHSKFKEKPCTRFLVTMVAIIMAIMFVSCGPLHASAAGGDIKVILNGEQVNLDNPPVMVNNRLLVPFRAIFKALGAGMEWDDRQRVVKAEKGEMVIFLKVGANKATINEREVSLDTPAILLGNHLYVPLRFVSETLEQKVSWDQAKRQVVITSPSIPVPAAVFQEKILEDDTELVYRPDYSAVFKAGTRALVDGQGHIKRGILKDDTMLPYRGLNMMVFRGGTEVEFNDKGCVAKGTLKHDSELRCGQGNQVWFTCAQPVAFYPDGQLQKGTIINDSNFHIAATEQIRFKARTEVEFDEQGYLVTGVLAANTNLRYSLRLDEDGNLSRLGEQWIIVLGEKPVTFSSRGLVIKGTLSEDSLLYYGDGLLVDFKEETEVSFDDNGFVKSGTLLVTSSLKNARGLSMPIKKETVVQFFEGYLSQGILGSNIVLITASGSEVPLKEGSLVVFDEHGYLKQGTISGNTSLLYSDTEVKMVPLSRYERQYAMFMADTRVEFTKKGLVKSGILAKSCSLPIADSKVQVFTANTRVTFDEKGFATASRS